MLRILLFLLLLGFGLTGCGGGGPQGPTVISQPNPAPPMSQEAFARQLSQDEITVLRIAGDIDEGLLGIPGTNWSSVPVAGQALFLGLGQGIVGDMAFRGDALLTVDFSEDDITGGLRNIVGSDAETTYSTEGALIFSNGDVRATRPTDFTVDYAGTLVFGDDSYVLDGTMTGLLRGTRLGVTERSPIKALSAIDTDGVAMVNGASADVDLTIVAETR